MAEDRRIDEGPAGLGTGTLEGPRPDPRDHHELAGLRPVVRGVVRHVLGSSANDGDVDDCASEALKRALEFDSRREPGTPLRPWVLGIARNVGLDARRARRRALARHAPQPTSGSSDADANADDDPSPLDRVADGAPRPDQRLELAERTHRLQAALQALPEDQRRAVLLHAQGHGYREISERLSAPMGTICTWISRARQGLACALKDDRR